MRSILLFVVSIITDTPLFSQTVKRITFNVDMSSVGLKSKDSILNVDVRGNVAPLTWVRGIKMKDIDKDGIYSAYSRLESF